MMKLIRKLNALLYYLLVYPRYKLLFKFIGKRVRIVRPLIIEGYENISIGNKVIIRYNASISALPLTGVKPILDIGDGTVIGNFCHIYATQKIIIGRKVLTADKVYISDNLHQYEDISIPIIDQPIKQIRNVIIGDGSWIGENVCIIGATVGKGCVIGANSVVVKPIPDYSVAVGSPARIIKRYHLDSKKWMKTNESGDFI